MNTKEKLKRVIEQLGCADYSEYSFDELLEQYDMLKAIEAFENTQPVYTADPSRKAKEIALDAAVKIFIGLVENRAELVKAGFAIPTSVEKVADEIYQWLIKTD